MKRVESVMPMLIIETEHLLIQIAIHVVWLNRYIRPGQGPLETRLQKFSIA